MHTSKSMNNPVQIVNNTKNGKEWSVSCLPVSHFPDASFQSKSPTILPSQGFPTTASPQYPTFHILSWTPSHLLTAVLRPGQKILDTWPRSRAFAGRKFPVTPERCGFQSGGQRHSSRPWTHRRWLQQQKKEYSLTNINRFLIQDIF